MVSSVGALLSYLKVTQITGYERINTFEVYNENQYMNLDYNTRRNLELTRTMMNKEKKGSLIWLLDKTKLQWVKDYLDIGLNTHYLILVQFLTVKVLLLI